MAVQQVRIKINGAWTTLVYNSSTGKYEATIAAPNTTSFNVNSGHYYPITIEASDNAGNVTTKDDTDATIGANLRLLVKEVTPPTILITSPTAGAYLSNNAPIISFQLRDEANGSGIKISSLTLQIDSGSLLTNTTTGMSVSQVAGGYNITYTPQSAMSDGNHIIKINVQDNDGNAAIQSTVSFTVDTVPPVLSITNPSVSTLYINSAPFSLAGTTSDVTSGLPTITISLNGVDQGAVTVNANGTFSKVLTLRTGQNDIVITATDLARKTTTVNRTIFLDTIAPTIGSISITPNPVYAGQNYTVSITVTDA